MSETGRRAEDRGWMCLAARRASQFWDFIDRRQIDAYAISVAILAGTIKITDWAMEFVDSHPDIDLSKAALVIGAVMVPWSGLQAAAVKFLFDARTKSFEANKP